MLNVNKNTHTCIIIWMTLFIIYISFCFYASNLLCKVVDWTYYRATILKSHLWSSTFTSVIYRKPADLSKIVSLLITLSSKHLILPRYGHLAKQPKVMFVEPFILKPSNPKTSFILTRQNIHYINSLLYIIQMCCYIRDLIRAKNAIRGLLLPSNKHDLDLLVTFM